MRRWFTCIGLVFACVAGDADSSHAVDRATAASTVVSQIILGHPQLERLSAFGPQSPVVAGTLIQDGFDGRDAAVVPNDCWLFWIDPYPEGKYGHPTELVLVEVLTGIIVVHVDMSFWPRYDGVNRYRDSDERVETNPDLIYFGPDAFSKRSTTPELRQRMEDVRSLAPDPAAGKWALVLSGSGTAGNSDEKADVDSAKAIFNSVLGVPNDNITTIDGQDAAAVCMAMAALPKNCPKFYVYVTAHGLPGRFFTGKDSLKAAEFAGKLKALMAGEYCIVMAQCYSGSFLDAFRDSSLSGVHMTSAAADTTAWARKNLSVKFPWRGEIFTHYWAHCLRSGKRGTEAYECARDSVTAYVARRHKAGAAPHDPKPSSSVVFRDSTSGQATAFKAPSGTASVCIAWKPGAPSACGNASVYCQVVNGPDTTWKLVKVWNWNLGQTRYFSTDGPGATGNYRLVSHANGYPDCGDIRFLSSAVPETPSSQLTFAAGSLGWRDGDSSELTPLPFAGGNGYFPGLDLGSVPRDVGLVNGNPVPLALFMQFQPDPSRPWLYLGGNPAQGIDGRVTVEVPATGLFDPFGQPVPVLNMILEFMQGPDQRFFPLTFVQTPQGVQSPVVDMGSILPQQFQLVLRSAQATNARGPGDGFVRLDAFIVNMQTTPVLDAPPVTVDTERGLSSPTPNPFADRTRLRLAIPTAQRVRASVVDVAGRHVRLLADEVMTAGSHVLEWDGREAAGSRVRTGIYFVLVETERGRSLRKVVRMQ